MTSLKNFVLLLTLIPLILSIGIVPAIPFASAQLTENSQCSGDQVLVKRYSDDSFHCLDFITTTLWDTYGTGKIVDMTSE